MSDYVVLKRLTLKSELGWFKSVFDGHKLKTNQKAFTLNKEVINAIWPSLLTRQNAYEAHKVAMDAAEALGSAGEATLNAEKAKARAVGTIPVKVELHGPGGKPPLIMDRVIALQDKNWRLNGDFVLDPPGDPQRFFPTMQEGDLALIGFNGTDWPTATTVVLLSQAADAMLWHDLQGKVTKGLHSMVPMNPADLVYLANAHGLDAWHVIRQLAGSTPGTRVPIAAVPVQGPHSIPPPMTPSVSGAESTRKRMKPVYPRAITPAQLAEKLASATLVGQLGEKMVNAYLATQGTSGQPVHTWVSENFAEHPYDFELLGASGAVQAVVDAKSTSGSFLGYFHMSAAEVVYAANSLVPYHIYRISRVAAASGGKLWISGDIRNLAATVASSLQSSTPPGIKVTGIAVHSASLDISWSEAIPLPPLPPQRSAAALL